MYRRGQNELATAATRRKLVEAVRHLNIKSDTPYLKAQQKLYDNHAVTETKVKLRDKLNLRLQEVGETK